jgi:nucleic acid/nucleotide deaminase of polymorphic system toxin
VSKLDEVAASIRRALDKSAQTRRALIRAAGLLDEANQHLTHALAGSHDPEAQQARPIVSGEDELYAESVKAFPALGLRRGLPRRASDVEMKLAAYMRNHGIRSATVVINNIPCPGPYGCDELVPVLLPEGCTLTVHGPNNFTKTYQGGATPPWRTR